MPRYIGTGRLAILLASCCCLALADHVVLKNGDRVSGQIVKKDGKNFTIKSGLFGDVTTSWDQVQSIETDNPVTVVLQDGRTAQGTLSTAAGSVEVAAPAGKLRVAPTEIATIRNAAEQRTYERLQRPGWLELWNGTVNVGFAGTAGNARTLSFTTSAGAARTTTNDKTSIHFDSIKASAFANGKNADTASAIHAGIGYDHNFDGRLFANVFNNWEYDRFQNLDLRFVLGGGLGYHLYKNARSQLDVLGGGDYNHARFSTPLTQNNAEFFGGDSYSLKLNSVTSLVQNFRIFGDADNLPDYRVNFDLGATTKLSKWLNWNVTLSDRYLHYPPMGRKTNDLIYTTGVGVSFAR